MIFILWVVQTNCLNEQYIENLTNQLEKQETEYHLVKVIPFEGVMIPDIDVDGDGDVFTCGSTTLGKIAKKKGWLYFNKNLDSQILLDNWKENMLNPNIIISELKDVQKHWDKFFIRPCDDSKSFSGEVMTWEAFENWRWQINHLAEHGELKTLSMNDRVAIAPLTEIYSEYRFFVVDGELVSWSLYKRGNRVFYSDLVGEAVVDFAREMVRIWQPDRAFVLDIADTPDDYKVIECNSINSSGFYKIDLAKFVYAINNMVI